MNRIVLPIVLLFIPSLQESEMNGGPSLTLPSISEEEDEEEEDDKDETVPLSPATSTPPPTHKPLQKSHSEK